jgi:hypothetical protein
MKVQNEFLEFMAQHNGALQSLLKRDFGVKKGYWIMRGFDKLESESKAYFKAKRELITKYAVTHEEDDPNGKYKKGSPMLSPQGNPLLKDPSSFNEELDELQAIEIEIDFDPVSLDEEDLPQKMPLEEQKLLFQVAKLEPAKVTDLKEAKKKK